MCIVRETKNPLRLTDYRNVCFIWMHLSHRHRFQHVKPLKVKIILLLVLYYSRCVCLCLNMLIVNFHCNALVLAVQASPAKPSWQSKRQSKKNGMIIWKYKSMCNYNSQYSENNSFYPQKHLYNFICLWQPSHQNLHSRLRRYRLCCVSYLSHSRGCFFEHSGSTGSCMISQRQTTRYLNLSLDFIALFPPRST